MIHTRPFGRTTHDSSAVIFGAAALGDVTQAEADATLEMLDRYGVNHIDTAASYGDAELRIGPWMAARRSDFFIATKTGQRTYQPAYEEICRSLERLKVDHVDLLQLHNLVDESEWEVAMGPDGALEAAVRAQEEGLTRFLGVTGHGRVAPRVHLRSLDVYDFDSVLLPYSYVLTRDRRYADDFAALLEVCRTRRVAVQTIKSIVRSPWHGRPQTAATWYEPLTEQADIDLSVHWVLGEPDVFLNSVGDIHVLPAVLDAAQRFSTRPTEREMEDLLRARELEPLFP